MPSETPRGYPTGAPVTITTEQLSSNPISQPISDPDTLEQGFQEVKVSIWGIIILLILYIIMYLVSRQRDTWMLQQESLSTFYLCGTYTTCEKIINSISRIYVKWDKQTHTSKIST